MNIHNTIDVNNNKENQLNIKSITKSIQENSNEKHVERLVKFQLLRFARRRRLLCKNGMYLAIDKNGVHGTKDANNPYADLQVLSIGSDMIAMWGSRAGLYLAVHPETGCVYTTPDEGRHCVFLETLTAEFYNLYESYRSVFEGHAQCIVLNSQNKLVVAEPGVHPGRNGQFIWEMFKEEETNH